MVDTKVHRTENAAWFLLKLFFTFGGVFGIMVYVIDRLLDHQGGNWLRAGLFFGTGMTAILGIVHLLRGRRHGWTRAACVAPSDTTVVSGSIENAMSQVRAALDRVSARGITLIQGDTPTLTAKMPFSLWSFGERVRVELHDAQDGTVKIEVSSRPMFFMTMVDYGKNLDNVDSILKALKAEEKGV